MSEKNPSYALIAATEKMRGMSESYAEFMGEVAKQRKAIYDAHRAAGFTEAQALEISFRMLS